MDVYGFPDICWSQARRGDGSPAKAHLLQRLSRNGQGNWLAKIKPVDGACLDKAFNGKGAA
jgi:hypothetical protein